MSKAFRDEFPNIGAPAFRALNTLGITRLSQLKKYSEAQLLELHGFGPRALLLLKQRLAEKGLSLRGH